MPPHPDGIWIIDENARTLYASKRMAEILGTSRVNIFRQRFFAYVFPEDICAFQLCNNQNSADPNHFRFRLLKGDGSVIWVEVQASPLLDVAERVRGTIGVFRVAEPVEYQNETHANGQVVTV